MPKSWSKALLPHGCGATSGNWFAGPLLYGYAGAVWAAAGWTPVGVGPGKPTTDSGGNNTELTVAGNEVSIAMKTKKNYTYESFGQW
jgi:hypothetical protein